ncbi:SpoIIE family protein phosphatase [Nocardioides lianchengensis]|uniref:Serine phosphatase RsbU, regulator of sigma subunit n=1 Tax=Nocardioides lianchengensis TaxID=1045774 RepID=A0A1G7B790_9ACTN|nr:SpoIIE family protein phosphatase [Nocardioides lianchengensis]NYG10090.1 GAF domain-containing protein [Nocardioides lianchengensis]SDE22832.1 Serine phosphatase RsbU, regulator of sigma subunit [Nocardioides lianchengensis]
MTGPGPFATGGPSSEHDEAGPSREQHARRLAGQTDGIPALNRLADLAARLTGAGSAQVSIIADDQTVMGGVGDAADSVGGRSPAADSLCTVTVRADGPVVVVDAAGDPRVDALPPVTSGVVGSYLGVPLVADGHTVGALCVFDRAPREWSEQDVSLLEQLAGPVLAELELAALTASYDDDRLLWQLAVDAAGVGVFDWDLATGELRWDERLLVLFGLTRETFGGTIEAFNASVHVEDRERVAAALSGAIATCSGYAAEYRVVRPTGEVCWISARGRAVAGPDGEAARVVGAAYDTTAVQDGEARVARVLETMPSAFFAVDRDWRFTYANAEALRLLGGIGMPLVGGVLWELFPAAVGSEFERSYRHAMETGEPVEFEAYYPVPLDTWYEVRVWPSPDGLSVYFVDVTARRTAEEAVARAGRRSTLLAEVTRSLSDTLDAEEAVARLAQLVVPVLGDWCVVTLVEGNGPVAGHGWRHRLRDIGAWHHDPERRGLVQRYAEVRLPALTDSSYVAQALGRSEPVVVRRGATDAIAAVLEPGEARDLFGRLGPDAAVVVPLRGRARTVGLLSVFRDRRLGTYTSDDLDLLTEVAVRAGSALDNARAFSQQQDLALGLQRSMLTAPPQPEHLQVAVRYEPAAESAQVGGDWYDAFQQPDGSTSLVIGDVVGHDTAAAAAMGQVRSLLRGIAVTTGEGPAGVLRRVDGAIQTLQVETTATAVVARLEQTDAERDTGTMRFRWSNAGHPPPLVAMPPTGRPDDPVEVWPLWAATSQLLLGLHPDTERDESVVALPRGATVLLYTDGLVEHRGQSLDEGLAAMQALLARLVADDVPLEELCDRLLRGLLPELPDDDVALVAVRLT